MTTGETRDVSITVTVPIYACDQCAAQLAGTVKVIEDGHWRQIMPDGWANLRSTATGVRQLCNVCYPALMAQLQAESLDWLACTTDV